MIQEDEKHKSIGHRIAWGESYQTLYTVMLEAYLATGASTPAGAEEKSVYHGRELAASIDEAVLKARTEEIDMAIVEAIANGSYNTLQYLRMRRDDLDKQSADYRRTADQPEVAKEGNADAASSEFTVKVPT